MRRPPNPFAPPSTCRVLGTSAGLGYGAHTSLMCAKSALAFLRPAIAPLSRTLAVYTPADVFLPHERSGCDPTPVFRPPAPARQPPRRPSSLSADLSRASIRAAASWLRGISAPPLPTLTRLQDCAAERALPRLPCGAPSSSSPTLRPSQLAEDRVAAGRMNSRASSSVG
ncbi:hypothetical protein C8J57DRAFT_1500927 [Mycena rebaudengoi]|nr:hypothetical protein C8J57DRAFT_1500927 [Mycena rebaudengoi]